MPKLRHDAPSRAIGRRLKAWREERGLSLRAVGETADSFPERVGFDYLSRLERGELMPSIPKLATLAAVYRRPISELVDLYEAEQLRQLVPKRGGSEVLRKLGKESIKKGEVTKALACFLGALDAARREGADRQRLALAHNNVGGALLAGGRYLTARQYLEEGLRHVETIQTRCRILDNLAITHYHLDNLPLAELFSREAWELASKDDSLRCSLRGTRAAVLIDLKRYAEAERLLRDALDEAQEAGREAEEIRHRFNLGCCLSERGDTEEGLRHLRIASGQAAERGSPDLRATSLCFFGRSLYKAGRKDEALGPLLGALQIAQKHNFRNDAFLSAYYLWCLARENQEATAEAKYLEIARQHRIWLQQRSEEAGLFDVEVRRSGRRRRVSSAAGPR